MKISIHSKILLLISIFLVIIFISCGGGGGGLMGDGEGGGGGDIEISTPQETVDKVISSLFANDVDSAMDNFSDITREKYRQMLIDIQNQGRLSKLAEELDGAFLREENGFTAKYGVIREKDGKFFLYEIYMYKDSNGEWRIRHL